MTPAIRPITLVRGDAFGLTMWLREPVTPGDPPGPLIDLTGYQARAQIRATRDLDAPLLAEFSFELLDQVTDTGGYTLTLTPAQTATLTELVSCGGFWDCEIFAEDGVDNTTIVAGNVRVIGDVTRA